MNNDIYTDYALLDAQEKEIKAKKEAMRLEILKLMVENNLKAQEHSLGKFSVKKLKTWTYPERIVEMSEQLKAEKALAESTGEATYTESDSLAFTGIKL